MKPTVNSTVCALLHEKLIELENYLNADLLIYYGPFEGGENQFLAIVEDLAFDKEKKNSLYIMLTTPGGSATVVERFVNILRQHYQEIHFIIPDYAYSAGTIFCMSGDSIHMDYFAVLGPIDPQVKNKDGKWVAALGYLDKINELIVKAQNNSLSQAEFIILKDFDLAELKEYEQAKNLTIALLEKWLVKYKFKNWNEHRTNSVLLGSKVTEEQKIARAKEIADKLSDNNHWKSHGRPINIEALKNLGLEIDDYSKDEIKRNLIRSYHELLSDFVNQQGYRNFVQTRKFI